MLSAPPASSYSRHEAAVAAFMAAARRTDPERYRRVCDTYPVLVGSALRRRLWSETPAGSGDTVELLAREAAHRPVGGRKDRRFAWRPSPLGWALAEPAWSDQIRRQRAAWRRG